MNPNAGLTHSLSIPQPQIRVLIAPVHYYHRDLPGCPRVGTIAGFHGCAADDSTSRMRLPTKTRSNMYGGARRASDRGVVRTPGKYAPWPPGWGGVFFFFFSLVSPCNLLASRRALARYVSRLLFFFFSLLVTGAEIGLRNYIRNDWVRTSSLTQQWFPNGFITKLLK